MADWNTHLYCAHKVNEVLKLEGRDLDLFLYGNILPDINLGWMVKPTIKLTHELTHFDSMGQEFFWAPLRFYEKYKEQIDSKNPLFLGFLFHLWIDVALMTEFVSNVSMGDMISRKYEVREWKWRDTRRFISKYSYTLSSTCFNDVINSSESIDEINITESDLMQVQNCLSNDNLNVDDKYYLFDEETLSRLYEKNSLDFINWLNEL